MARDGASPAIRADRARAGAGIPRARSGDDQAERWPPEDGGLGGQQPADTADDGLRARHLFDDSPATAVPPDDDLADDDAGLGGWVPGEPDAPGLEGERGAKPWTKRLAQSGAWGVLAERWVPEPLRGARVDPGRRGAVLLSAVAALAAVVAAVGVWWARPVPTPIGDAPAGAVTVLDGQAATGDDAASAVASAADAPVASSVAASDATAGEAAAPAGPIMVSVTGQVRRPGLVTLPAGARVADAIDAAGGVTDPTLLAGLNLAAHLTDGASVVVAGPGGNAVAAESTVGAAPASGGAGAPDSALININTADSATLQQLSGVGPVTAEAIITYRTQHGPFTELGQLQEVSGIGPATYAKLAPHVTL